MEPVPTKRQESPAWENPGSRDNKNESDKTANNATIKTGGNSRSAEDDPDLDKQPYRDNSFKKASAADLEEEWEENYSEDPDEQSF